MGKGSAVIVFLTMMAEQYLVVDSERYTGTLLTAPFSEFLETYCEEDFCSED